MKRLFPDVWQWSWFSEEKQLDFNGLFLVIGEHRILVDPPPVTEEARTVIRQAGPVDSLIITNRDHVREAVACRSEFGGRLLAPALDAAALDLKPDVTYGDGEVLPGGVLVIGLKDQKSPGESALFLKREGASAVSLSDAEKRLGADGSASRHDLGGIPPAHETRAVFDEGQRDATATDDRPADHGTVSSVESTGHAVRL
ncbi:MAG: hypothetical protein NNA22_08040 [Nitrospira sp.]|nr:hypothetical protein [Nitrospira sp.]